jgi:thiol peroxidase
MQLTMKGNPVKLVGNPIKIGDTIDFIATNNDLSEFKLSNLKGKKVISIVPSVDTSTCSTQTSQISQIETKYNDVTFITISLDLPFAQAK